MPTIILCKRANPVGGQGGNKIQLLQHTIGKIILSNESLYRR